MNRLRLAVAFVFVAYLAICISGCVSVQRDPDYDGAPTVLTPTADATTFVRITIENHRTVDAIDPRFYLIGRGPHSLGIVRGMGGKLVALVNTSWFGPDGCMTIIAHYAGGPDLTFERFCWRPGQVIDVALDDIFNPVAAWAHR